MVKFYYAPGRQTTRTLGAKTEISRKQAELMREELVRPFNTSQFRNLAEESFAPFVEEIFFPMKIENGDWRENTAKESMRVIRQNLLAELGQVTFAELSPSLLRNLLRKKAGSGLGRQTLNHLRAYLTDIRRCAVAEGYLLTNVSEGLKTPVKLVKSATPKKIATMEEYARAWKILAERERLCFDLVMFAGMRESEAFAIKCGNLASDCIHIERSWYKGKFGPPKTPRASA